MNRTQHGFTLVELMITMVVFMMAAIAASNIFAGILNQFKQQTKIAETNIEGVIGLQMFRTDLEQAGYGLPFDLDGATYEEAFSSETTPYGNPADFNDATDTASNPPRAVQAGDNLGLNGSDVLVIKATNIGVNAPSQKWAYRTNTDSSVVRKVWTDADGSSINAENFAERDRVIVLRPVVGSRQQVLVSSGGNFFARFDQLDWFEPPVSENETHIIYGIKIQGSPVVNPKMPFNRADFYVRRPTANMPQRCARGSTQSRGTGILYKGLLNHGASGASGQFDYLPLLDCVLDMQVVFGLDMDEDGADDTYTDPSAHHYDSSIEDISGTEILETFADAALLRNRLRQIRIYILAQEGQMDTSYTYPNPAVQIIDRDLGLIKTFDLSFIQNWSNYRWKLYTMVVTPYNLR
jgi:prepilin-type N-terminal cleavage/methylation domain-containing protein